MLFLCTPGLRGQAVVEKGEEGESKEEGGGTEREDFRRGLEGRWTSWEVLEEEEEEEGEGGCWKREETIATGGKEKRERAVRKSNGKEGRGASS
jgi:hypothetical protein